MRAKTIDVIVIRPVKADLGRVTVQSIDYTLEAFQKAVDGLIEAFHPLGPELDFICNEEGKLRHLAPNFEVLQGPHCLDTIVGTVLVCRHDSEGDFVSVKANDFSLVVSELLNGSTIRFLW